MFIIALTPAQGCVANQIGLFVLQGPCEASGGRVRQIGTPRRLYEKPATRFVADFLGEANVIGGELAEVTDLGEGVLTVPFGSLRCGRLGRFLAVGNRVDAIISPEAVRLLGQDEGDGENVFPAVVEAAIYLGEKVAYRLRLSGPFSLRAAEYGKGTAYQAGSEVRVRIPPEAIILIRGGGEVPAGGEA